MRGRTGSSEYSNFGPDPFTAVPIISMVYDTIRKLKNNRVPGEYLINTELIEYGGRGLWKFIQNLIVDVWNSETMPNDEKYNNFVPFSQRGQ